MRRYISLFFILSLINLSCQKEDTLSSELEHTSNIDSRLVSYFIQFENEASTRGLQINIADQELTATINNISAENVAGVCTFNSASPNHITIDEEFFNSVSTTTREFIIYHELGHCVLGREHEESQFTNGRCTSIMRSGLGSCRDNYNANTREAYLDELFSIN